MLSPVETGFHDGLARASIPLLVSVPDVSDLVG